LKKVGDASAVHAYPFRRFSMLEAGRPRPFGRDDRSNLKIMSVGLWKAWRLRMFKSIPASELPSFQTFWLFVI
jgi:hypothetical protein